MAREAKFIVAAGKRGVGKTYKTLVMVSQVVRGNPRLGVKGRKVLILDTNNEYGDVQTDHKNTDFVPIKTIDITNLKKWVWNGVAECRRILPIKTGIESGKYTTKEMQEILGLLIKDFRDGMLIVEDPTKFISDSLPSDLIGGLIALRHVSTDVVLHFQSKSKIGHPQIWANTSILRLHKTGDRFSKHIKKFDGYEEPLYICESLVDIEYKNNNIRFCANFDKDNDRIFGAFDKSMFVKAIEGYLQDNVSIVTREAAREDIYTGKKVHKDRVSAIKHLIDHYTKEYYGNKT